ncbi:MAG: twin-arginine translocase subunit TatC [Polyangiaceae bacterium]|nr:twin-arginine translocase subunit TatC [Polyangiaceae bacterium]MCE7891391.1 twin-arginine translocase subunit TatC [Sorangiineae bacterium PRO1]MCL4752052.1 twin-arginine translocase subunit TatC [Myxococcales bacterium]
MSEDPEAHTMTFWEHLEELRSRLVRAIFAFLIGSVVCWVYREQLLSWLTKPFIDAWNAGKLGGHAALHFPAPASLFVAYIKIALLGGLVVSLPIILYQLWSFVAPGLYSREKKLAIPFVVSSCLLFAGGGYFGWKVAFPVAFQYLLGFSGPVGAEGFEVKPTVMIGDYIEFVSRMLIAFGAVFELPVLIFFLSIAGVVTHKHLLKFLRYFIVLAFVIAAIITPPDVTSQFLLAVPLVLLYVLSIGIAWLVDRSRNRAEKAES